MDSRVAASHKKIETLEDIDEVREDISEPSANRSALLDKETSTSLEEPEYDFQEEEDTRSKCMITLDVDNDKKTTEKLNQDLLNLNNELTKELNDMRKWKKDLSNLNNELTKEINDMRKWMKDLNIIEVTDSGIRDDEMSKKDKGQDGLIEKSKGDMKLEQGSINLDLHIDKNFSNDG